MLYWQQRENFWKQYTHSIMQIYSLQCIIMQSACSALLLSEGYMYSPCIHRSLGHSHWSDRCSYRGCTLPGSDPSGHGRSLEHSSGKHRKILSKNIITAQQVAGQISLTKWQFTYCHERHCSTYSIEMFFSLTYMLSTWPVQWARAHQREMSLECQIKMAVEIVMCSICMFWLATHNSSLKSQKPIDMTSKHWKTQMQNSKSWLTLLWPHKQKHHILTSQHTCSLLYLLGQAGNTACSEPVLALLLVFANYANSLSATDLDTFPTSLSHPTTKQNFNQGS